jgi:flagellar P-ring protein precursor FlgI
MRLKTLLTLTVLGLCLLAAGQDNVRKVRVRLKDVARLKGDEQYTLTGYGVVVGLNNTGDSDESLIQRTIANIMQNFNVIVNEDDIKAQNTAVVMVTAMVKGPAHKGDMIEASVSAVGDSSSLLGGELLLTPILGADAEVWGVAQGPVTTGGFFFGTGGDGGNTKTKNHPTSGILTNGIKLLRDVDVGIKDRDVLTYYLLQPDYTKIFWFSYRA